MKERSLRNVLSAAAIGSTLEWYDFYIYSSAAALVFNKLFFPNLSPINATLASFATFGVGFVARPFGGLFFGHLGDRLGRKPILITTLLMVGIGTALIGMLPTYAAVGALAPILLVALRLVQGFASGAEYGGAVIMAVEYAPAGKRGIFGSLPTVGVVLGSLLASGIFALVVAIWKDALLTWAWRIPFLLSFVLVVVGLYIRTRVDETPVFASIVRRRKRERMPVIDAIRKNPRNFLVVVFVQLGQNGLNYTLTVFGLNYMTSHLHVPRGEGLLALVVSSLIQLPMILLAARATDRVGRRPIYIGAALFTALTIFPFFWALQTRAFALIVLAYAVSTGIGYGAMFGAQATFFAELFAAGTRYSGFAFARELGTLFGGGPGPLIAIALLTMLDGRPWAVAGYVVVLAVITAAAVISAPETYRSEIRSGRASDEAPGEVALEAVPAR